MTAPPTRKSIVQARARCSKIEAVRKVASWMFRDFIEDGTMSANGVVWFLAMFIYACETVGGMESVALTDAVQCCFLMVSFIATFFLIEYKYNGFVGFFGEEDNGGQFCDAYQTKNSTWPEEHPAFGTTTLVEPGPQSTWSNGTHWVYSYTEPVGLGVFGQVHPGMTHPSETDLQHIDSIVFSDTDLKAYNMTQYGCVCYTNDWWLNYPPHAFGIFHWWFPLGALPLGMTPAGVHRAMVAKSDDSFRRSATSLTPL